MSKKNLTMSDFRRTALRKQIAARKAILLEQVQAVAQGYTSAMFIFGPGGLGKSHMVLDALDGLCGNLWVHHTAYSTPKALFQTLQESRQSIHLFEDVEKLYKTDVASSILRAACGAPRGKERWVTYETAHEQLKVSFEGGIIIISNEDLSRSKGPLAAVASRFRPVKWDLTTEERMCLILDLADEGFDRNGMKLTPAECRKVSDWLVGEMSSSLMGVAVELRTLMEHAYPCYVQWRDEESEVDWRDVLRSKLVGDVQVELSKSDRVRKFEDLAETIHGRADLPNVAAKVAYWVKHTEKAQAQYYRYLKSAQARNRAAAR